MQTMQDEAVQAEAMQPASARVRQVLAPAVLQEFILHEADLLDRLELESWLSLLTADAIYWVPAEPGQTDATRRISLFYDDRSIMDDRIWRLRHPKMFSQRPPARQVRVVSNFTVAPGTTLDVPEGAVIDVRSKFILFEHRLKEQRTFGGVYEHGLVRSGDDWKIARKTVRLANCDAVLWNLGVPL
jgi:3-phenylpropionate/cinnamic acid dioxygenase small subunit